jgi:TrmH family RNA methyltransferase
LITSTDNPRVKEVLRLRKSRERRRAGMFVAEGRREVERARAAGLTIHATYYAPALIEWPHDGAEEVSDRVLAKMAYRAEPEGVLAIVEAPRHTLPRNGTLYLVSVGIEKPGNLGALARTAAAAGADALVVAEAQADPWNPNAIRASTGAVFSLPVVEASLDDVRALPAELVAATTDATLPYTDADLRRAVTIAVGAEDSGLPQPWQRAAAQRVTIPLAGGTTDSLNAATAAAIVLFEARRQRAHA